MKLKKHKKILTFILPILTYFILYGVSFAKDACNMKAVKNLEDLIINLVNCFLDPIIILLVSFSILLFLWGVLRFIMSSGDEKNKTGGKEFMFWGIIGLFVIVSLWGLVSIFQQTFQLNPDSSITPKEVKLDL
ncbi:MAG: hypothetical protein V1910_02535 [bacterium]